MTTENRKRVLILGAGFAGLYTALYLEKMLSKDARADITLVDWNYYHLFTPLLQEAASGVIDPGLIMIPIRRILRGKRINFLRARIQSIDLQAQEVTLCCMQIPYDLLVIALGSVTEFYGLESVRREALELKSADDADQLRCHVIDHFEAAIRESDPHHRRKLLTFVVVGGGCTGVETVTELHEFLEHLRKDQYNDIDPAEIRLVLVEARDCILSQMGRSLSETALWRMQRMGIEVMLDAPVAHVTGDGLEFANSQETLPTSTIIWVAGVRANPVVDNLPLEKDRSGRVVVASDLRVPGHPTVYVLGDAAHAVQPQTGAVYPPHGSGGLSPSPSRRG